MKAMPPTAMAGMGRRAINSITTCHI